MWADVEPNGKLLIFSQNTFLRIRPFTSPYCFYESYSCLSLFCALAKPKFLSDVPSAATKETFFIVAILPIRALRCSDHLSSFRCTEATTIFIAASLSEVEKSQEEDEQSWDLHSSWFFQRLLWQCWLEQDCEFLKAGPRFIASKGEFNLGQKLTFQFHLCGLFVFEWPCFTLGTFWANGFSNTKPPDSAFNLARSRGCSQVTSASFGKFHTPPPPCRHWLSAFASPPPLDILLVLVFSSQIIAS